MKISEMNPQEKTLYNRESKKRQRAKEAAAAEVLRLEKLVPNAFDYQMPAYRIAQLADVLAEKTAAIAAEATISELDEFVIDGITAVTFGFENRIVKIVTHPDGQFVGGHFPLAVASLAIQHVHCHPQILQSAVFAEMYQRFLLLVQSWSRKNSQYADCEFVKEINAELAGEYILPQKPVPDCEPILAPEPEPPVPSDAEVLERGRIQTLTQIERQGQNPQPSPNYAGMDPRARRFLEGV